MFKSHFVDLGGQDLFDNEKDFDCAIKRLGKIYSTTTRMHQNRHQQVFGIIPENFKAISDSSDHEYCEKHSNLSRSFRKIQQFCKCEYTLSQIIIINHEGILYNIFSFFISLACLYTSYMYAIMGAFRLDE